MIAYFAAKRQIPLIFHTFLTYNPAKNIPYFCKWRREKNDIEHIAPR